MRRLKQTLVAVIVAVPLLSCASYKSYETARTAEASKDWDKAVQGYEKALDLDPDNMRYRISAERARLEASRVHFEKGKTLRAAAEDAKGQERIELAELAATELQLTVKLDPTNQYAAIELGHTVRMIQDAQAAISNDKNSLEEMKKRANITKIQPPQLNPTSDQPISLSFPRETPVKEIYRALGNAFGINIMFDQAVKDDRISIELKDVTAQQALERVMQAAGHFYKALDEHTIIVVPDNPQSRRDYEDLVIRTFYLSNGDAEQVTNVVRTMIEARNVFPLKALNAITIRDTADKVRIAEKIIEANDKAKAEVVVDVELLQMDLDKTRDLGFAISGGAGLPIVTSVQRTGADGKTTVVPITGGGQSTVAATLDELRNLSSGAFSFSIPQPTYSLLKSVGNAELLANPQMRISEGEKASLHIGQRIPVPVTTFTTAVTGSNNLGSLPATSYQYQDVGIKVSMEPRVHHNHEVTLKLTVEVSNQGPDAAGTGVNGQPAQPTFVTRTIETTIRLKDGETNFLAGLIQQNVSSSDTETPFLSDIPLLGRLFTQSHKRTSRTDLVMTMTPHIVRIPDITDDDLAPMWVGTQNNLTFRGLSPRIESQTGIDPFTSTPATQSQFGSNTSAGTSEGPSNVNGSVPVSTTSDPNRPVWLAPTPPGGMPSSPFNPPPPKQTVPTPPPPTPEPDASLGTSPAVAPATAARVATVAASSAMNADTAALRLVPRMGPQPVTLEIKPGEEKLWTVVGMDLDGLSTPQIVLHFDPQAIDIATADFGSALSIDPKTPPVVTINRETGIVKIASSDGKPLSFVSGGDVVSFHVRGTASGDTFLVMETPDLRSSAGDSVQAAVSGGRARVN